MWLIFSPRYGYFKEKAAEVALEEEKAKSEKSLSSSSAGSYRRRHIGGIGGQIGGVGGHLGGGGVEYHHNDLNAITGPRVSYYGASDGLAHDTSRYVQQPRRLYR